MRAERSSIQQHIPCGHRPASVPGFLFVGSDRGGRTAAKLYSLVGSCEHHRVDPFAYLKEVLEQLPTHPADRMGELLPDAWLEAHPQARRKLGS